MDIHLSRTGKSFFAEARNAKPNSRPPPAAREDWRSAAGLGKVRPPMKLRSSLLTAAALSLLPLALSGQVAPAPATPAPGAVAAPAKKTPLSSADKQLIKSAAEPQLVLLHLSDVIAGPTPPGSASVQKLAASAKKALNDAWGDVGTVALGKGGEMPPTVQTAAEKKELGELRKLAGDKFDKAYLKAFQKESKRVNLAYAAGAKSAQDPDLKAAFAKYQPIVAKLDADAIAAEAEGKKK
jgi:hypothetical protein